jgi:pimeloyl-ACP methyl ester carboxylesterase
MSFDNQPDEERLRSMFKREIDPAIIEKIMHYYESSAKIGWRECFRPFLLWMTHSLTDVLQSLQCPIICINSDRRPTELKIARKYHPTFDVRIVPNTGHPVMLDAPEEFNRSLEEIIGDFNN